MRLTFPSAAAIPAGVWVWPHIDPATEWADHATGEIVIETDFLDRFERLRAACGFPLPITSGYRTPAHNAAVSSTGPHGPHTTARAVDVSVLGTQAFLVVQQALALGFTGIGLQQSPAVPAAARFVHCDDLPSLGDIARPMVWSY